MSGTKVSAFSRHELKYVCSANELATIAHRISPYVRIDGHAADHGEYQVISLYFDDARDACLAANEAGIGERYKYRIRYYDRNLGGLRLEKKSKSDGRIRKAYCPVSLEQYQKLYVGDVHDFLYGEHPSLLKEFSLMILSRRFMPKVIVRYERKPFIDRCGNVRVTLDMNISAGTEVDRFLQGDGLFIPVQERAQHLLEVKYDEFLPAHIRRGVYTGNLIQETFSKYSIARKITEYYRR